MADHWDFYFFVVDGRPCSTMLDLALVSSAPLAARPWLLSIRLPLAEPRTDGLSANTEAEVLGKIEDALVRSLEARCGALFVGRMTYRGVRDLFFYARKADGLDEAMAEVLAGFPKRRALSRKQHDPGWRHYLDVLYPGPLEWQWIKDRRVVDTLKEQGDRSDVLRPIDHHAFFDDEAAATAWAASVRTMGFEVEVRRREDQPTEWTAHAVREDPAVLAHVHDIASRLYGLAEEHGGRYDGWGCSVVRPHDA